jgi:ribosome-associated translation inhibitor RaiA
MSKEGSDTRADVTVHAGKGIMPQGNAIAGDTYAAFDEVAECVGKRLHGYKHRLRDVRRGYDKRAGSVGDSC